MNALVSILSKDGELSSRRVVGFSSFLLFALFNVIKAFFNHDLPDECIYSTAGMTTMALFATAFQR